MRTLAKTRREPGIWMTHCQRRFYNILMDVTGKTDQFLFLFRIRKFQ